MQIRTYLFIMVITVGLFFGLKMMDKETDPMFILGSTTSAEAGPIPEQAIRLRIIANSDSVVDQTVKHKVRDAILAEVESWERQPETIEEARKVMKEHLPFFQQLAEKTLQKHGLDYDVNVDFGKVSFPTKLYGDHLYPAGKYEALRITLGQGEGENWWCVLFPPLCFVDMSTGDAISKTSTSSTLASGQALAAPSSTNETLSEEDLVEVRFFLLDAVKEFFSGLFE